MKKTLYDIFGISPDASAESIRTAYKSLVQRHHPDKNRGDPHSEEILKAINYAYSILSNTKKRAAYDLSLGLHHNHHDAVQTRHAPVTPTPPAAPPEPPPAASPAPEQPASRPSAPEKPVPQRNDTVQNAAKPSETMPPPYTSEMPSGPTRVRIATAVLGIALVGGFLAFLLPGRNDNVEIAPLASNSLSGTAVVQNSTQDAPAATTTPPQKGTAPAGEQGIVSSRAISPANDHPEKIASAPDTHQTPPAAVPPEKPTTAPTPPAVVKAPNKAAEQVQPVQPAKTLAMNANTGNAAQPAQEKIVTPQAKAANSADKSSGKPAPPFHNPTAAKDVAPKTSAIEQKQTPATLPSAKTPPPPTAPAPKTVDAPPPSPSHQAAAEPASKPIVSGDATAHYKEGLRHEKGESTTQDYSEAARLYQKAAAQGVADAQYRLGRLYTLGKGVPLDNVEAYAWLSLAAASHVEAAKPIVEYLGNIMTPQQIEEAKRKAKARQASKKR
ncbi:MAG: DnaJ domain-containing protein [Gammaproteobacteria bacterium]|nr:DnaJ domain-containing protein [Gammaproteobacteria bacterium]